MDLNDKVTQLEDEIKILKNEVQAVLLDLRESFLNNVNPFNPHALPVSEQPVIIVNQPAGDIEQRVVREKPEGLVSTLNKETEENKNITDKAEEIKTIDESNTTLPDFEDLYSDQAASFMPGPNINEETKYKGESKVWHPETETTTPFKVKDTIVSEDDKLGLSTIEAYSRWVDKTVSRLGHARTRTILEIAETMGYMRPDLKNILVRFIHPVSVEESLKVTTQDYLSTLVELHSLLSTENRMEVTLLFMLTLCQEYDNR
jgi:hypothetical protein